MSILLTTLCLNNSSDRDSSVSPPAFRQAMSFDDSATAFTAASTNLGSPTTLISKATTNTRTGNVAKYVGVLGTGDFNGVTIRRFALHNIAAGSVTGTSATVELGVDGQGIVKGSTFSLTVTLFVTYQSP